MKHKVLILSKDYQTEFDSKQITHPNAEVTIIN
jgi:hypothetical protein